MVSREFIRTGDCRILSYQLKNGFELARFTELFDGLKLQSLHLILLNVYSWGQLVSGLPLGLEFDKPASQEFKRVESLGLDPIISWEVKWIFDQFFLMGWDSGFGVVLIVPSLVWNSQYGRRGVSGKAVSLLFELLFSWKNNIIDRRRGARVGKCEGIQSFQ